MFDGRPSCISRVAMYALVGSLCPYCCMTYSFSLKKRVVDTNNFMCSTALGGTGVARRVPSYSDKLERTAIIPVVFPVNAPASESLKLFAFKTSVGLSASIFAKYALTSVGVFVCWMFNSEIFVSGKVRSSFAVARVVRTCSGVTFICPA